MEIDNITLTISQQKVFDDLIDFLETDSDSVFILKGYAGTGKTTMMKFLVNHLEDIRMPYRLLASTGRAAKVLQNVSHSKDYVTTIHSMVYSFHGLNKDLSSEENVSEDTHGQLFLVFEPCKVDPSSSNMVYIVDESSMISDVEARDVSQAKFGSGRLLKELLEYDSRPGSKFIFVGDPCQLPPLEEYYSPALMPDYIRSHFNLRVREGELTQIMRQKDTNSIVNASKLIRTSYASAPSTADVYGRQHVWGKFPFRNFRDILLHSDLDSMVHDYVQKIKTDGYNRAVFLCRSNKVCNELSLQIRTALGMGSGLLAKGDLLLVTQNNFAAGLMNGDLVTVEEVLPQSERVANMVFRRIKVKENITGRCVETYIIEDILRQARPNLDSAQQNRLFYEFIRKMKNMGIRQKDALLFQSFMQCDPMLNALRCTYGYAITCHKAQGGEWQDVYIHVPRNITLNPTKETYQWVYTAMTRAKDKLHWVDEFYIS